MKKSYKIREGSIAFYCQRYYKLCFAALLGVFLIATVSSCDDGKLALANTNDDAATATSIAPKVERTVEVETEEPEQVQETKVEEEPQSQEAPKETKRWDVPLDSDLQEHIYITAKEYGVDPDIVVALISVESTYNADVIGDNGNSFGLMQIQPRWNKERMKRLGVEDLLDPYNNVLVGIDVLKYCIDRYDSVPKGLVAYNQGHYKGTITKYAEAVLAAAEEL